MKVSLKKGRLNKLAFLVIILLCCECKVNDSQTSSKSDDIIRYTFTSSISTRKLSLHWDEDDQCNIYHKMCEYDLFRFLPEAPPDYSKYEKFKDSLKFSNSKDIEVKGYSLFVYPILINKVTYEGIYMYQINGETKKTKGHQPISRSTRIFNIALFIDKKIYLTVRMDSLEKKELYKNYEGLFKSKFHSNHLKYLKWQMDEGWIDFRTSPLIVSSPE
jgi:hypothetical protein